MEAPKEIFLINPGLDTHGWDSADINWQLKAIDSLASTEYIRKDIYDKAIEALKSSLLSLDKEDEFFSRCLNSRNKIRATLKELGEIE